MSDLNNKPQVHRFVHIRGIADVATHDRLLEFVNGEQTTRWLHVQKIDETVGFERYSGATVAGSGLANPLHTDRQGATVAVTDQATGTRGGSVCLNSFGSFRQWISRSVMLPTGLMTTG